LTEDKLFNIPIGFCDWFIETSDESNEFMKMHVVNLTEKGLAFKKNIDDPQESPAIKIIEELVNLGAECMAFLVDHDQSVCRDLMASSPVVVDWKNLFCSGEEVVSLGIGEGDLNVQ